MSSVDSRLIQLERGTCHTLWHRLVHRGRFDHTDGDALREGNYQHVSH